MLTTLSRNIKHGNTFNCIELFQTEGKEVYRYLSAKLSKGELQVEKELSFPNFKELIPELPKDKPYHLVLNNEEVLYASISTNQTEPKSIVQEAYPNIRLDDFYYECIIGKTTHVFICQKAYVETCIRDFEKEKIYVTEWSLGFSPITGLKQFVNEGSTISLDNFIIQWVSDDLIAIPSTDKHRSTYDIEGVSLSSENIIPFSGALISYIGKINYIQGNYDEIEKEHRKKFGQHRFFKLGLPVAVGILFLLGVINTMVYTSYFGKVQELVQLTELNKAQRQALVIDDSLVNKKQKLFEDVIKSTSSRSSFYIDQIASLKPLSISLSAIAYQPFAKRIRDDKPILLENNKISIKGSLTDTEELSSWIRLMERESFINEIAIDNLSREQNKTNFTLSISINED